MLFRYLARFATSGRGKQQSLLDCIAKIYCCLNIPAQMGNCHLLIDDAIWPSPRMESGQSYVNNSIGESENRSVLVINERSMGGVSQSQDRACLGMRVGIVCHDGSCRLWENRAFHPSLDQNIAPVIARLAG